MDFGGLVARMAACSAMLVVSIASAHVVPEQAARHGMEGGRMAVLVDTALHVLSGHAALMIMTAALPVVGAVAVRALRRLRIRRALAGTRCI
jgi:hypothetical protein